MKKFFTLLAVACLTAANAMANIVLQPDVNYTSIAELEGKTFAIVNEAEGKAYYGSNAQNLAYGAYADAFLATNSGYMWKAVKDADTDAYYLQLVTPAGTDYNCWNMGGVLNSQGEPQGWACSFILGVNGQKGQDIPNGALYELNYTEQGWTMKNVGTGMYTQYSNGPANSTEPTYWSFCSLKEVEDGIAPETFVMPASVKSLIENGTQFYLKSGDKYLIGGEQQAVAMVDWATAVAEAKQSSMWVLTENEDGSGMFRAVTVSGDNVSAWGANPCYLNCQPSVGGVLFKMNKDQDFKNGSSWILNEVEGGYTLQNVGNKGYALANGNTGADAVVWQLYLAPVPQTCTVNATVTVDGATKNLGQQELTVLVDGENATVTLPAAKVAGYEMASQSVDVKLVGENLSMVEGQTLTFTQGANDITVTVIAVEGTYKNDQINVTVTATGDNGKTVVVKYEGDTATSINNATAIKVVNVKLIENGKLVIVKNGVKYNAAGVQVK